MIFKNLSKTIEEFEEVISKAKSVDISQQESNSLEYIDFSIAQSIIKDIGKTTSLEIAHHILAHYVDDIEY